MLESPAGKMCKRGFFMSPEEIEVLFEEAEYELLIEKVLMRCGVFASHNDYEDYRQELCLALLEKMGQATSRQVFLADHHGSRLFGWLVWRMKDFFRKGQCQQESCQGADEALFQVASRERSPEAQVEEAQRTQDFWVCLSEGERDKLAQLLADQKEGKLDRRVRYKLRKALEKKLKLF